MGDIDFIDPYRKVFEHIPTQTVRKHFASIFGEVLGPLGFHPIRDQVWIRDTHDDFQHVLTLQGNGRHSIFYGVRLNFSPTIYFKQNGSVVIHNHRKSDPDFAILDLTIDPHDGARNDPNKAPIRDIDGGNGLKFCLEDIHRERNNIIPLFRHFVDTTQSLKEILDWYTAAKDRSIDGLGFENIVSHHVSYPLLLAKCGQIELARRAFNQYCVDRLELSEDHVQQLTDRLNTISAQFE